MTKPNAIEELMADAVLHCDPAAAEPRRTYLDQARSILAALDAAGLAVVPKDGRHVEEHLKEFGALLDYAKPVYEQMVAAFNPADWKPKP